MRTSRTTEVRELAKKDDDSVKASQRIHVASLKDEKAFTIEEQRVDPGKVTRETDMLGWAVKPAEK